MRRNQILLALAVYVVPVAVAAALLVMADLAIMAVALVLIEVVVASMAFAARRRPVDPASQPPTPAPVLRANTEPSLLTRRPWLLPAVLGSALALMVAIAVLGSKAG